MVENLFSGDREVQIQAATELSKLSSKQRHRMAERGIISPLVSMLQSQDYEAIEASLLALLGLAFGSERFVSFLLLSMFITTLQNPMNSVPNTIFGCAETKSGL